MSDGASLLTSAELAERSPIALGPVTLIPSTRTLSGSEQSVTLEPRVAQLLTILADAGGSVVTRETLFARCWGTTSAGDDSLNRAIASARRALDQAGAAPVAIETIPRTGYRLVGLPDPAAPPAASSSAVPRRAILAASAAGIGLVAFGAWRWTRSERQFETLVAAGEEALLYGDPTRPAAPALRQAAALQPDNAQVQGLLAYALAFNSGTIRAKGDDLPSAQQAIDTALARDPNEPHALLARTVVLQSRLGFAETEDAVRGVLKIAPDNIHAMRNLWNLLQCVGRSEEGLATVEQAMRVKPMAALAHYPLAQFLWITGHAAEADRVIDQALAYWPEHRFVRFAYFTILAFTGRARAARAMLDNPKTAPQQYSPGSIALWRLSLDALDQPNSVNVRKARDANFAAARADLSLTSQAVQILSALGEVDAAFELIDNLFVVPGGNAAGREAGEARSRAWRFAPWLFIPPTAAVRADPRFDQLCDSIGLTAYWRQRGIQPDYRRP